MRGLVEDARDGWRALRGAPGLAALSALTFAVGIGGTTAMFSFVSGVLLTPLPYRDPARLVVITRNHAVQGFKGLTVPADQVAAWRALDHVFDGVTGLEYEDVNLSGDGKPERAPEQVKGVRVLPDLLPLLGIEVARGRTFVTEEVEAPRATAPRPARDRSASANVGRWS